MEANLYLTGVICLLKDKKTILYLLFGKFENELLTYQEFLFKPKILRVY